MNEEAQFEGLLEGLLAAWEEPAAAEPDERRPELAFEPDPEPEPEPEEPQSVPAPPAEPVRRRLDESLIELVRRTSDDSGTEQAPDGGPAHVVFRLGSEAFGLRASVVARVARLPRTTPVPGAPRHITGAIHWEGEIVPVADLRRVRGRFVPSPPLRMIVAEASECRVALAVDEVTGVTRQTEGFEVIDPEVLDRMILTGKWETYDGKKPEDPA
jgi:chemotaxis signal transduction protein